MEPQIMTAAQMSECVSRGLLEQEGGLTHSGSGNLGDDHVAGNLKGQIADEKNRDGCSKLLGCHVEIFHDALELGRRQVLAVDIVKNVQDTDDGKNYGVHLPNELLIQSTFLFLVHVSEGLGHALSDHGNVELRRSRVFDIGVRFFGVHGAQQWGRIELNTFGIETSGPGSSWYLSLPEVLIGSGRVAQQNPGYYTTEHPKAGGSR